MIWCRTGDIKEDPLSMTHDARVRVRVWEASYVPQKVSLNSNVVLHIYEVKGALKATTSPTGK